MNKMIFAKVCGVLCILIAVGIFAWTVADFSLNITYGLVIESFQSQDKSKRTIAMALIFSTIFFYFVMMFLGFLGYYLSGSLGEKVTGKIVFGLTILLPVIGIFSTVIGFIYFSMQPSNATGETLFTMLRWQGFFGFFWLLVLGIAAFIINKAGVLKSLIPIAAFIYFLIIYTVLLVLSKNILRQANALHLMQLTSIIWILMGTASFIKNKRIAKETTTVVRQNTRD